EVIIDKDAAYNFSFFSFTANATVNVDPQNDKWDINITTFTNTANLGGGHLILCFSSDFVVNNSRGGSLVYSLSSVDSTYDSFTLANVDQSKFTEDQRGIGSLWRATSAPGPNGDPISQFVLKTDIFFVLKDPAGNLYKIKMTGGALPNLE